MNFSLNADAAQSIGGGIGNLFKAFALGPAIRDQYELKSILGAAKTRMADAAARKYGAEAAIDEHRLKIQEDPLETAMLSLGLPTSLKPAFQTKLETGSFGPSYEMPVDGVGPIRPAPATPETVEKLGQSIALMQRMYGTESKVHDMAKAHDIEQTTRDRSKVISDPSQALSTAQGYFATSGKAPFDNVSNTGYSINSLTGGQFEANPALAKLFNDGEVAQILQRNAAAGASNASAGLSSARRDRVVSGLDKPVTIVSDETGQASITALPTRGDPRTIGVVPPKGTGVEATNAKTRNAVIAAVEKEMPGADENTIKAEVDKRLARRDIKPTSGANSSKMPSQIGQFKSPDEVRAAFRAGKVSREDATAILQKDFGMK